MVQNKNTLFSCGVFAFIFEGKNKILLCHRRDYDLWNLPGGRLEEGESPWEGVIRETKEETGFDVIVKRLSGIYYKPEQNEIVFCFICEIVGGNIQVNDEADTIEYFLMDAIPKNTIPKHIERIKDILDNPEQIIMKIQR